MKLDLNYICDYLVNQFEHTTSTEEAVKEIVGESKDLEFAERVSVMIRRWIESESIKYWANKDLQSSEKFLHKFIKRYLGQYI